ncbi:MAG TPA: SAM-dependent methyltransferase [Candidatus Thermoplasmatota archaeon]|nr:SAM-dependent methyltransferase [Candidatus Thermoplasmatota archaeon]
MSLAGRLAARIARDGPMPFDQWMDACLYDPEEGYYMRPGRKTGAGEDADFVTSPTLHPFFGAAVGKEAAAAWERLGSPDPYTVVEFGGGEGDLARAALAWLDRERPALARKVRWVHIERSPAHRAKQVRADHRIAWAETVPRLDIAFIVANEFLDALAFKWLERTEAGWDEVHVAWDGEAFAETLLPSPVAPTALVPPGVRIAWHQAARAWLRETGEAVRRGEALVIDYGERYLWGEDHPDGAVRTYRRHEDAGAPWERPGDQDITASLEFAELAAWAREAGWREAWFGTQEAWLLDHGILDVLNATRRDTPEGASSYLRLRQILLPSGLGSFKVQRLTRS